MANDIDKTSPHYKGDFGSIYEVNKKFPAGGVAGDFVVIEGWAHYWNADRATWCVNAERDSYWDELITNIIEKFKLLRGATYMGVASLDTVPAKVIGAKMYYFATVDGTYKNFGDLVVPQGINVLYSENGSSWVNTTLLEVAQELGVSTKKVVSQKALNDALNLKADQSSVNEELAKKADKETVNTELAKKFDKESVVQESGEAEDKVMSQKAVSDKLSDLLSLYDCSSDGSTSFATLAEAIASVPLEYQKGGLTITFNSTNSKDRLSYTLSSQSWSTDPTYWIANHTAYNILVGRYIKDLGSSGVQIASNTDYVISPIISIPKGCKSLKWISGLEEGDDSKPCGLEELDDNGINHNGVWGGKVGERIITFEDTTTCVRFSIPRKALSKARIWNDDYNFSWQYAQTTDLLSLYDCSSDGSTSFATLAEAIASVPLEYQKGGLTITFNSTNSKDRLSYTLSSQSWSTDPTYWIANHTAYNILVGRYIKDLGSSGVQIASNTDYVISPIISIPKGCKSLKWISGLEEGDDSKPCGLEELDDNGINHNGVWGGKVGERIITFEDTTTCVRFSIPRKALSKARIWNDDYNFSWQYAQTTDVIDELSIDILYPEKKYNLILSNLNRPQLVLETGVGGETSGFPRNDYKPYVMLHFGDIHNDSDEFARILAFYDKYKEYIDDVFLNGDIAKYWWYHYSEATKNLLGNSATLCSIGNHDIIGDGKTFTSAECYDRYFVNIDNWGVIEPENNKINKLCYYYKDIPVSKVRFIVLDVMHNNDVQLEWFAKVLSDAREKSLSVVVAQHIPITNEVTPFETQFDESVSYGIIDYSSFKSTNYLNAVDSFIDAGGEFITWLFGHTHTEYIGIIKGHEKQIYRCCPCASPLMEWQETCRSTSDESIDSFDIMSFDTITKTFTIKRIGYSYDRLLRRKSELAVDYANRKVLYSN